VDPYCGVWVTGFRMPPVPCMGTNSLFTKGPVYIDQSAAYEIAASKAGLDIEYLSCRAWKRLISELDHEESERVPQIKNWDSQKYSEAEHSEFERHSEVAESSSSLSESSYSKPSSWTKREKDQRVVHMVIPDGTVQGTQLAHHLVSTMLCQNPELFHPNAMQSILAGVLVYLLKEPFESDGWRRRQLEWVSTSYERAYALSTCSGAVGEHRRFEAYMTSLMDPECFRMSLITDAADHPRELKCQGLSKAVLGMWPGLMVHGKRMRGSPVSKALLERWRLGLVCELFHRLGLSLDVQVALHLHS
jgi:hypothetical protein